ncbi:hypothetical protein SE17_07250 [Kouleothrix aurantiaca]|uniref:RRXRR domain-containing protein n=1 Tax=Kouleothrix aurantiaca TaxID=186479 RepID=A0A0P9HGD3_9CHLR|nr:hypothetical protein SE17_07250 [Kouleothrix aurantiaca]
MKVFVRNHDGAPLMPCTPAKARKLLRAGKARMVARAPFTIQLGWQCEGHVQAVVVGIDKGSGMTGISCVGNGEVLLAAEIRHRRDVKEKLDTRRAHRRSRRLRKWYRPPRFLNRASSTRGGRLLRYQVRHPIWQTYPVLSYRIDLDWASVYGPEWALLARVQPYSAVLAVGSPVLVFFGGTPGA